MSEMNRVLQVRFKETQSAEDLYCCPETEKVYVRQPSIQKEEFEVVTVLGHPMLFTCCRIIESVPEGLYVYDVRHDDDQQGLPVQIAKWVLVNHWGTLLSDKPLDLIPNQAGTNAYLDIDPEEDWNYEGTCMTVQEYMEQPPCIE